MKHWGKTVGQAAIPGNFKRRYTRSPYDSGVLIYQFTVLACILFNRPMMSRRKVVYRLFFQCWLIFFSQNYQSRSKEYNSNWCWHRTLHLKKKRFPTSKIFSKHQEQQGRSFATAVWRYCRLACVLIALQVVRTLSPGFRPRQFFPSFSTPWTGP